MKLLWWLRNIAITGEAVAILFVTGFLHIPLSTTPLWLIIGMVVLLNIFTIIRIKTAAGITEIEFFCQLFMDVLALFGLLYYTGGATNPFTSMFIVQVIIAAITLPPLYTWLTAAISVGLYVTLMFWNVEVPYLEHNHSNSFFSLHVQGMLVSFVMLSLIVSWFVVRMNRTIRRQDSLLAEAEKMAAIGTLAASSAHELGTPLATMMLLAEQSEDRLLKEQVVRCKNILSRITMAGGVTRAEGGEAIALADFLDELLSQWKNENPETAIAIDIQAGASPRIIGEYALEQAIKNLLDNAADASPHKISFLANWSGKNLIITIKDKGEGIPEEISNNFGMAGVTTKNDGLGLGVFLSRNIINRLGGSLIISPSSESGTQAVITLPISRICV